MNPTAIPTLPPGDERVWIDRIARLRALGAESVPTLVNMLAEPNWSRRRHVVAELAALGDLAIGALCATLEFDRANEAKNAAAIDTLVSSTGDVTNILLELASHPVPAVAADAVQVLGRRRERAALAVLTRLATGTDDNVAVAAIEALGSLGGRGAVESLIALVRSGNFFRTFPAIDVLGRSGDPRAIAPLAALLQDSRYALEAIRALSRSADRAAVVPLAGILAHASPMFVRVTALALATLSDAFQERYGDSYVIGAVLSQAAPAGALRSLGTALLGADIEERRAIARVLGMLGNPQAVPILSGLLDDAPAVARIAVQSLEALGPTVANQLLMLLRTADSQRRAMVLPLITSRMDAVADVVRCLSDPDGQVRALAAQALARIGAVASVAALFDLLEDPNVRVVQAAVAAIQSLGSNQTEQLTLSALASSDPRVQREGLRIVRYFGYRSALPKTLELTQVSDVRLREAAILALSLIEDSEAQATLIQLAASVDEKTRAMAMRALGQAPRTVATEQVLLRATSDPEPWVRYYATQALGSIGASDALPRLRALLTDAAPQVRVSAIEALSHLPCNEAFEALREAATTDEPDLRRAAVLGLGSLRRTDALPILIGALQSTDAATRLVATSALGGFDTEMAVAALGRAANDPDESVRSTAIGLLATLKSKAATLALIGLLPEYRNLDRVRLALSEPSPGRIEGLVFALTTADDETAAVLASALARMRTPEAQQALVASLTLPSVAARKAIATALGALGTPDVIETLRLTARTDPDEEVRRISTLASAQS
ncbi:MAG TPA: HEAT repeat domain-containing protein [Polyangiaceae bacterium]|nr:HEAT repeat domain-containing protein [Polyangiaceae bacterium]